VPPAGPPEALLDNDAAGLVVVGGVAGVVGAGALAAGGGVRIVEDSGASAEPIPRFKTA